MRQLNEDCLPLQNFRILNTRGSMMSSAALFRAGTKIIRSLGSSSMRLVRLVRAMVGVMVFVMECEAGNAGQGLKYV